MTSAAFPAQLRLRHPKEFKRVFDAADIRVSQPQILILAKRNALPYARLGLVVGKKNCRLATQRNSVKRILRESFRHRQLDLAGLDLIALARKGIADLDKAQINLIASNLWHRVSRQCEKDSQQQS